MRARSTISGAWKSVNTIRVLIRLQLPDGGQTAQEEGRTLHVNNDASVTTRSAGQNTAGRIMTQMSVIAMVKRLHSNIFECLAAIVVAMSIGGCTDSDDCGARLSVATPGFSASMVSIDGRSMGATPMAHVCVGEGNHTLSFASPNGERDRTMDVNLSPGDWMLVLPAENWNNAVVTTEEEYLSDRRAVHQNSSEQTKRDP